MNRNQVKQHIGKIVILNGDGDLAMAYKSLIFSKAKLKIIKLTRGGMVHLKELKTNEIYNIPPKNVELVENNMRTENICLFDLDGTLVDFDKQMKEDMALLRGPDEEISNPWDRSKQWIINRKKLIMQKPGWWRELPIYQPGFDIFEMTQQLDLEIHVLTKGPSSSTHAWGEKIEWCRKHLPNDIKITLTEDKGLVYGKILVDDWPDYITRWLKWRPRGLVIMPCHEHNRNYIHKNVVRYDGTNIGEVQERMMQAIMRKPGKEFGE